MSTPPGIPLQASDMVNVARGSGLCECGAGVPLPGEKLCYICTKHETDARWARAIIQGNSRLPKWFITLFRPWLLRLLKHFVFTARERGFLDSRALHELILLAERGMAK